MKPYSGGLRERVVQAVLIGTPRDESASRFAVSMPTIERWLRLQSEAKSLSPKPVSGPMVIKTNALVAMPSGRLSTHADATLAEQTGGEVSTVAMSRALTCLAWMRKKRR